MGAMLMKIAITGQTLSKTYLNAHMGVVGLRKQFQNLNWNAIAMVWNSRKCKHVQSLSRTW